jgi:hypothetical protein
MKTLKQFNEEFPIVAEGVRVINQLSPSSQVTYLTYRSWVKGNRKPSAVYKVLLFLKGIKI